jgi:Lon protease-like protein
MNDDSAALEDFTGTARLFPLPNLVLFPQVVQPLHIFEPRYRQMTADAVASDQLLALVLPRPGWEADYEGRPPLHAMACLAHILNHQQLPDGRYNLLVRGLCRLRLQVEIPSDKLYRLAHGQPLPDPPGPPGAAALRQMLADAVRAWLPPGHPLGLQFAHVLQGKLAVGALCDLLGFALPLGVEVKQALLEEVSVDQRVRRLVHELKTRPPSPPEPPAEPPPELLHAPRPLRKYPPDFSVN